MAKLPAPPAHPLVPGTLLTDKEVAAIFRVSRGQVWHLVKEGILAPPFRLSSKTTRWRSEAIIDTLNKATA
jgi:predicted DNA-binding transcriptional regulator AlpA